MVVYGVPGSLSSDGVRSQHTVWHRILVNYGPSFINMARYNHPDKSSKPETSEMQVQREQTKLYTALSEGHYEEAINVGWKNSKKQWEKSFVEERWKGRTSTYLSNLDLLNDGELISYFPFTLHILCV